MIRTATISSKGQITLPAEFRRQLKLKEGDKITIVKRANSIEIKASTYDQEFEELRKQAEVIMKKNGTWGMPWEEVRKRADEARTEYYRKKYGSRT